MKVWIVEEHTFISSLIEDYSKGARTSWSLEKMTWDEWEAIEDPASIRIDALFVESPDQIDEMAKVLENVQLVDESIPIVVVNPEESYLALKMLLEEGINTVMQIPRDYQKFLQQLSSLETSWMERRKYQTEKKSILLDRFLERPELMTMAETDELMEDVPSDACFQMLVLRMLPVYRPGNGRKLDLVQIGAARDLELCLGNGISCIICDRDEDLRILLIGSKEALAEVPQDIERFLQDMREFSEGYVAFGCWGALGDIVCRRNEIQDSFQKAVNLIRERYYHPPFSLLKPKNKKTGNDTYFTAAFRQAVINCVEAVDLEGIEQIIMQLVRNTETDGNIAGESLLSAYTSFASIVCMELCKLDLPEIDVSCYQRYRVEYEFSWTLDDLGKGLLYLTGELFETVQKHRDNTEAAPIQKAKQYIRESLTMPITLQDISDAVGYNPSYFSTYFKKETGMTLWQYITQTRVDSAKQLLLEDELTVEKIAECVGFNDKKYFEKSFKKTTGMTPGEFRKRSV